MFQPGTLWQQIQATTARALESGALLPLATEVEFLENCGVQFLVRAVSNLARKDQARPAPIAGAPQAVNPFLPYDPALYVAEASETHVCLLNKYNVVDHHLLIVTREFEHQQSSLTRDDFVALWRCLTEYESLGFYNAGTAAGASQPHKHLQLVPLPLAPGGRTLPLDPLRAPVGTGVNKAMPWPPFRHAFAPLRRDATVGDSEASEELFSTYHHLLQSLGLDFEDDPLPAYNLLATRSWMLVVPRRQEHFHSISLNALAFAGAFLVRNEEQMNLLQTHGPMTALQHVAGSA